MTCLDWRGPLTYSTSSTDMEVVVDYDRRERGQVLAFLSEYADPDPSIFLTDMQLRERGSVEALSVR